MARGGDSDWYNQPQPTISAKEILRGIAYPREGESQADFVQGQLGALDEGNRGVLNATNTLIARKVLIDFYRQWKSRKKNTSRK